MARIEDRVSGWWVFAGILLLIAGVLNIIWGIGAISDAKFFVAGQKYIVGGLHSWGWITLILGVIELFAGLSLFSGGGFGRWVGIFCCRPGGDQRAAVNPRLPVLVARRLCPLDRHPLRARHGTTAPHDDLGAPASLSSRCRS